jgi:quercetin dioxygenase-like cupin family protein
MSNAEYTGLGKARAFTVVQVVEYVPNSVVIKTIIRKATGHVNAVAFDSGERLVQRVMPFETFIQIIEGEAEVIIDGVSHIVKTGACIIVPAHASSIIIAKERFKMLSTVIKSGYDDLSDLAVL